MDTTIENLAQAVLDAASSAKNAKQAAQEALASSRSAASDIESLMSSFQRFQEKIVLTVDALKDSQDYSNTTLAQINHHLATLNGRTKRNEERADALAEDVSDIKVKMGEAASYRSGLLTPVKVGAALAKNKAIQGVLLVVAGAAAANFPALQNILHVVLGGS